MMSRMVVEHAASPGELTQRENVPPEALFLGRAVLWKANRRNLTILQDHLRPFRRRAQPRPVGIEMTGARVEMPSSAARRPNVQASSLEEATEFNLVARRNLLAGLWAGRQLGLSDAALEAYAGRLVGIGAARDLAARLRRDLAAGGVAVSAAAVAEQVQSATRDAILHFAMTD